MSRFTEAVYTYTGNTKSGRPVICLVSPLVYEVDYLGSGWLVTAEPGFCCDGPSVPHWAARFLPIGLMARASIVHDKLRNDKRRSKLLGDLIFFEAMGVEKVPTVWRVIAFAAVLVNFRRD